jgi:hypothetical protein
LFQTVQPRRHFRLREARPLDRCEVSHRIVVGRSCREDAAPSARLKEPYSLLFCAVLTSAFFPRRPMKMTLLTIVFGSVIWVCPLDAVHACPKGVPTRPPPKATRNDSWKGTRACLGGGVHA